MTAPAKINFKVYQGATFEQVLRWESETKTYAPITAVTKSAPVTISIGDPFSAPPVGWRVRVVGVGGMREINMPENQYAVATGVEGNVVTLNQINSLAYTTYISGGVLEYNTPVDISGYTARMQVRKKPKDTGVLLTLTTENGGVELDSVAKTITLRIPANSTALLDFQQAVYDLELITAAGRVMRFAEGNITVSAEVTR